MGKKSGSGSGMNDPDHISWRLKYLNSSIESGIRDERNSDPGWKKVRSGIWDEHPDPQHWLS
jgi:hypothetical protein